MIRNMIVTSAVLSMACGAMSPVKPSISIPHKERKSVCFVQVHTIPEVTGHGYIWVQVEAQGSCGEGPKWSIQPTGAAVIQYPEDPTIAYAGGQEGIYRVTATYESGLGHTDISIEH